MLFDFRDSQYKMYERVIRHIKETQFNGLLFAADTESVEVDGRWDCQLISFYGPQGGGSNWVYPGENPLLTLLRIIGINLGTEFSVSDKPKSWPTVFCFFHNLEYDWGQLIKGNQRLFHLSRFLRVIKRTEIILDDHILTFVRGLFKGAVCYVAIEVRSPYGNYKLELRDTFAFFSTSLAKVATQFGFPPKLERPEDIGKIDYRWMQECPEKQQFNDYAIRDAEVTYKAAEQIIEMHRQFGLGLPKVSASSYACAVMARMIPEDRPIINMIGPKGMTQYALRCYYGGRFGGTMVGRVDGINVFDINSSYPTAISCMPSFTKDTGCMVKNDLTLKQAIKYMKMFPCCFVEVSGREKNPQYPALVTRLPNGDLCPVYDRFEHLYTTGPELLAGIAYNTFEDLQVHSLVAWYDGNTFFKDFIHIMHRIKQESDKDSIQYRTAKVVINGVYGKWIESHNPLRLMWLDSLVVLVDQEEEAKWGTKYYELYMEAVNQDVDPYEYIIAYMKGNKEMTDRGRFISRTMSSLPLSIQDFGYYAIPPLAAAVTGIARARLYVGMRASNALYWDTDSLFTKMNAEQLQEALQQVPDDAYPHGVPRLRIGDELGELAQERDNVSGYLAGIKRYYFDEKKQAHHAMSMIPKDKIDEAIRTLIDTGQYSYSPGSRPMSLIQADTPELIGKFVELSPFVINLHLDYRMNWEETGDRVWVGGNKPCEQIVREVSKNNAEV